jgi:ubiquitin-conjugating enzyme E2 J1
LTPSGRFETNTKVCLSFSAYHPELWQPAWGIRLILEALISFLPTPADGAIGALDWKPEERKRLAKQSQQWSCPTCGPIRSLLLPEPPVSSLQEQDHDDNDDDDDDNNNNKKKKTKSSTTPTFAKEIAELHRLQREAEAERQKQQQQQQGGGGGGTSLSAVSTATMTNHGQMLSSQQMEEPPEEEIVFESTNDINDTDQELEPQGNNKNNDDNNDNDNDNHNDLAVDVSTSPAAMDPAVNIATMDTDNRHRPTTVENHHHNDNDNNNISWFLDPLLNSLIALFMAICYLLLQKYFELTQELEELQEWEYSQPPQGHNTEL